MWVSLLAKLVGLDVDVVVRFGMKGFTIMVEVWGRVVKALHLYTSRSRGRRTLRIVLCLCEGREMLACGGRAQGWV